MNKYNGWILSWRMSSAPLFLRHGELLGHSPIRINGNVQLYPTDDCDI